MNQSTAIFLVNPHARAVHAIYEPEDPGKAKPPRGLFKTLDPDVAVGDIVLVESTTRHGFTVVKVVETDVDFDPETTETVRWIACRLDLSAHKSLIAKEQQMLSAVRQAEMRQKRQKLAEALVLSAEELKALPIAAVGED